MKSLLRVQPALFALTILLAAITAADAAELREEFNQNYSLQNQGIVALENVNGDVHVLTWDRPEVKVSAVKRAKEQDHLDSVTIDVDATDERIRIKTRVPQANTPQAKNNSTRVDYTITVPKQSKLEEISSVNGNVEIENVSGGVKSSSVNGDVTGAGLAGQVTLSTVNGAVKANLTEVKKPVSLKSVNGAVRLTLPPQADANISADTVNGRISNDFDLQIKKHFPVGQNLKGKLGEGGPAIKLSSVNGAIRLDRENR